MDDRVGPPAFFATIELVTNLGNATKIGKIPPSSIQIYHWFEEAALPSIGSRTEALDRGIRLGMQSCGERSLPADHIEPQYCCAWVSLAQSTNSSRFGREK